MRLTVQLVAQLAMLMSLACAEAEKEPYKPSAGGGGNSDADVLWGGSGGEGGFGGDPSCVPPVSGGECDTFPQCGCEPSQACEVADASGTTYCRAANSVPASYPCNNIEDCVIGTTCVGGGCKYFCNLDTDCEGYGAQCFQVTGGTPAVPVPQMRVCTDHCEPWNQASCHGLACYPLSNVGQIPGTFGCVRAGTSYTTCSAADPNCAPGYLCMGDYQCHKLCRVGGADCSTECIRIQDSDTAAVGQYYETTEIGVCE